MSYVIEKKVFVEFFKNTANLDKWLCAIISFKIGLKWSMIHFSGTTTSAFKGFSEQTLSWKLTQWKSIESKNVTLQNVFCDYGSYE